MNFIEEEKKKVPIIMDCDVLIAGGGIAGIAAALAAARWGARVVLCEKQVFLGGLATVGLVTIYLPLCDGNAHQVVHGIGEELLRISIKNGVEKDGPTAWLSGGTEEEKKANRFMVQYNPHLFGLEVEQLLLKEGVKILYDTYVCGVKTELSRIRAVIIENKSGRNAIIVKNVIDATGDADIIKMAGGKTTLYGPQNMLAGWYYYMNKKGIHLSMLGSTDKQDFEVENDEKNIDGENTKTEYRFTGIDGIELSSALQKSHKAILNNIMRNRKICPEHTPVTIPLLPQVRMTRRLVGNYELDIEEDHKYFADSIGLISDWTKAGPIYEIPFRTLYGKEIINLAVAGRCISVSENMWDLTRVIPACAVTGEAAGTAAAMEEDFTEISISKLQQRLVKSNIKLHFNEVIS